MPTDRPDIFEELQAQILEGALQPGDRLKEAELAARYGISRTPVREALRRLETRGLLMHAPHKGMVVAELEASATAELYVMREILDGAAAALAAQHATEPEIAAMQRQITRDRQILDVPEQLDATNRSFHLSIYRAAHNRLSNFNSLLVFKLTNNGTETRAIQRKQCGHAERRRSS